MKKTLWLVMCVLVFAFLPAMAEEQGPQPAADKASSMETVTKSYALRYVSPAFIKDSLRMYFFNCSFGENSNMISVVMYKKDVAAFEEQLRKLDVQKKTILLRVFTVIAAREGRSDPIENKDLRRVLAEVSNLLNFKSYVLDGASIITMKEGTRYGELLLSSETLAGLRLKFGHETVAIGADGRRAVRLGLDLEHKGGMGRLLETETEVAENGYLVAGVSRLVEDGKSLVLVINAEIK